MGILSALGSAVGMGLNFLQGRRQEKMQNRAFEHGVQVRVEDAKRAGVHPVFALGAQPFSFSPTSVGDFSAGFGNMGANLDDMINKGSSKRMNGALEALTLERAGLENELLRSQIRRSNAAGLPAAPSAGGSAADILLPVIEKKLKFSDPMFGQKIENAWGEGPPQWIASIFQAAKDIDKNVSFADVWNAIQPRLSQRRGVRAPRGGFPRFGGQ